MKYFFLLSLLMCVGAGCTPSATPSPQQEPVTPQVVQEAPEARFAKSDIIETPHLSLNTESYYVKTRENGFQVQNFTEGDEQKDDFGNEAFYMEVATLDNTYTKENFEELFTVVKSVTIDGKTVLVGAPKNQLGDGWQSEGYFEETTHTRMIAYSQSLGGSENALLLVKQISWK